MGNCIDVIVSQNQSLSPNGKQDFRDQNCYSKVHPDSVLSPFPPEGKAESGDSLIQTLNMVLVSPPTPQKMSIDDVSKRRTVKIVVTRKQLEELLKNVKELEATGTTVQFAETFWEKERTPRWRWRPSLATIPE